MKGPMIETRKLENQANLGVGFGASEDDLHKLVELPAEPDEVVKYKRQCACVSC
jgi:hypothetical protein